MSHETMLISESRNGVKIDDGKLGFSAKIKIDRHIIFQFAILAEWSQWMTLFCITVRKKNHSQKMTAFIGSTKQKVIDK